jgi:hypothetical protein
MPLASFCRSLLTRPQLAALALACTLPLAGARAVRAETCTFLQPIGANGESTVVSKRVERPKVMPMGMLLGQTNWNTDFIVDQPYSRYKFFFTANSSDPNATYPVEGFMKFTDGTSLKVIDQEMSPPIGTGKMFGPFLAVPGKQASQMNFKVGASKNPEATGFSYRISVQGCN